MSDPKLNRQFRRRWEPPPGNEKARRALAGAAEPDLFNNTTATIDKDARALAYCSSAAISSLRDGGDAMGAPTLLDKWRLMLAIVADPALSKADVAVAATLLDMVGDDGTAWPSLPTLAGRTGQSVRNVIRCTSRLSGYFDSTEGGGRGNAKTYRPRFGDRERVTAPSPKGPGKRVTPVSPIPDERVTAPSRFEQDERVTAVSEKGDGAVIKRVTPVSPQSPYMNPLKESSQALVLVGEANSDPIKRTFAEFWDAFPQQRRAAKAKVLAKYGSIVKSKAATPNDLLQAARQYAKTSDVSRGYACAPLRWLNEERWRLDYTAQSGGKRNGGLFEAALSEAMNGGTDA
jgi:hypothetical protein